MGVGSKTMMHIHYLSTGEIVGYENTNHPTTQPDCERLSVDINFPPDPLLYKIDLATLSLVPKTDAEIAAAQMPLLVDVQQLVFLQLDATDQYMLPDRGLTPDVLAAWVVYRKALRDLSKSPGITDMINNFPARPDGKTDPAAGLRARLATATAVKPQT